MSKERSENEGCSTTIIVAVIGFLGLIIAAAIGIIPHFWGNKKDVPSPPPTPALRTVNVTGKWNGNAAFDDVPLSFVLNLKQDGSEVSGSFSSGVDRNVRISYGKIEDNKITFVVTKNRDGEETMVFTGIVDKNKMEGSAAFESAEVDTLGVKISYKWSATRGQ